MKKVCKLEDLDCANCAAKMERAIAKIDGVESVNISFMAQPPRRPPPAAPCAAGRGRARHLSGRDGTGDRGL